jgi:chemotaxis response regulator CheB
MIRVLVVDDHDFVREMVTRVLTGADGIQVVGECCDGAEVPVVAASTSPDNPAVNGHLVAVTGQ